MQFDPAFIGVSQNGLEQMTYLSLSVPSAPDPTPDLTESERDSWAEAFDMLFDEDAKKFAEKLRAKGIAPGEIGYEVVDEYDEVVATVELAWPEQKLGFLTECQLEDKGKLEKLGWRILTEDIEFDDSVFGGVADE